MSKPVIADNKPKKIKLEQGEEYLFCACGQSSDQPFCDGTHAKADTDLTPQSFTAERPKTPFCANANTPETRPIVMAATSSSMINRSARKGTAINKDTVA